MTQIQIKLIKYKFIIKMSQARDYLVNDTMLFSITLNDQEAYFLLFNCKAKYGKALIDYFETPGIMVDIKYDEVDDYFILPTIGEHIGKVTDDNQDIIKEICEQFLSDRVIFSFVKDRFVISEHNYLNEQSESKILGVILKTMQEFQNILPTESKVLSIDKFSFEVQGEEGNMSLKFSCTDYNNPQRT
jgi:hypothetical protein